MRRERPEALPIRSPFNHTIPLDTGKKGGGGGERMKEEEGRLGEEEARGSSLCSVWVT